MSQHPDDAAPPGPPPAGPPHPAPTQGQPYPGPSQGRPPQGQPPSGPAPRTEGPGPRPSSEEIVGSDPTGVVDLRRPAHRASSRAVPYWILSYLIGWLFLIVPAWVLALFVFPDDQWWPLPAAGALTVVLILHSVLSPLLHYRVQRWEITSSGVITRSGWLTREERVAPLNRVQTVDSKRGALMQLFKLASVTVTTASSAGAVEIEAIDSELAYEVVAELSAKTAASEGDAT